jgi:hypothetical protein
MRLLLTKQIVGIRDRGLPTESKRVFADPGDRVKVLFNNTKDSPSGPIGHYVCEYNGQDFIIFNSQFDLMFNEKELKDDILHPRGEEVDYSIFD